MPVLWFRKPQMVIASGQGRPRQSEAIPGERTPLHEAREGGGRADVRQVVEPVRHPRDAFHRSETADRPVQDRQSPHARLAREQRGQVRGRAGR